MNEITLHASMGANLLLSTTLWRLKTLGTNGLHMGKLKRGMLHNEWCVQSKVYGRMLSIGMV